MDILQAARQLRPGTHWNYRGNVLEQAEGETPVTVPTIEELQPVMDSDTTPEAILSANYVLALDQLINDPSPAMKIIRAILVVTLDEINILRQRDVDRAADTAAATSLANLQTRSAARGPALSARTIAQLKTAVQGKINAGSAD